MSETSCRLKHNQCGAPVLGRNSRGGLMGIVGGMDLHRAQITFDYADNATGEVIKGRIGGTRLELRE